MNNMTDKAKLLAERCEQATGPDWNLDVEIAKAQGIHVPPVPTGGAVLRPWGALPRYTASLDAAMTLVPEGWSVRLYLHKGENHADLFLLGEVIDNGVMLERERLDAAEAEQCATPALALTAAALRAIAAQQEEA